MIQRVLQEEVDAQTVRLELLIDLLDRMVREAVDQQAGSVRLTLLFASVLKARQAGKAVLLLAEEGYVEEILSISRTLIEATVNAAYLQCVGDKELERYLDFHPEKRRGQAGLALRPTRPGLALASGLLQRLGGLALRSGLPGRGVLAGGDRWTTRSLMDQARLADEVSKIPVMVPLMTRGYARGQAAMHGTISSLRSFIAALGSMELPAVEDRLSPLGEAFFGVNMGMLTLCLYLNGVFRLGMEEAIEEATGADSRTRPSLRGR